MLQFAEMLPNIAITSSAAKMETATRRNPGWKSNWKGDSQSENAMSPMFILKLLNQLQIFSNVVIAMHAVTKQDDGLGNEIVPPIFK